MRGSYRRRPPTILDVAARAGVSKSVVSLVLRGTGYVSETKRAAVAEAVHELGYRTNAAARSLSESRSRTVGVVLNDMRNPWFVSAVEGLNAHLIEHAMQMLMGDLHLDSRSGRSLLDKLLEMNIEGLVLVGTMPDSPGLAAAAAQVPTVVLGAPTGPTAPGATYTVVTNDDEAGARLAVEHLIALGHRAIAHVGAGDTGVGQARSRGYRAAMADAGLAKFIQESAADLTEEGGYRAGLELMSGSNRPTAVFAVNDMAALGVMSAADEYQLALPRDLSVVGYDNTSVAQLRRVSLTSVDNASYSAGHRAAELLLDRIAGRPTPLTDLLPPALIVRSSTVPPLARS